MSTSLLTPSVVRRFWRYTDASGGVDACWPWTAFRDKDGYGKLQRRKGQMPAVASRIALEIALGRPIHDGMFACHRCDNPSCVNPVHLFEGSVADNARDSAEKGRRSDRRGELHHGARLNETVVHEIRRLSASTSGCALARRFGVSPSTIQHVLKGRTWGHI